MEFHEYFDDKKLCVVACFDEYLRRFSPWRVQGQNQIFISLLKPYKEAQTSAIANWVKFVLKIAGIDILLYKVYSFGSALTSKAKVLGMCLKDILKRGQWSEPSTWQSHFDMEIVNTKESFEFKTAILNNALN